MYPYIEESAKYFDAKILLVDDEPDALRNLKWEIERFCKGVEVLDTFTDSDVPLWDSITTSVAFTAMWLMARKKLENYLLIYFL